MTTTPPVAGKRGSERRQPFAEARGWDVAVAVHVKIDLEEMQQKLSTEQQHAMVDGIGEILKASSPQPNNDYATTPARPKRANETE